MNIASNIYATAAGGYADTASGSYSFVGGGRENTADGDYAVVAGGRYHAATANYATVAGGTADTASGIAATVSGGSYNISSGDYSSVGGGSYNEAKDYYATVAGGNHNSASDDRASVGGGYFNAAIGHSSTVAGGANNKARGNWSVIAGGSANEIDSNYTVICGGNDNIVSNVYATICGGDTNTASGAYAFIGGGQENTASGDYATVAGGYNNTASGSMSFAGGTGAIAQHKGCFIWADSSSTGATYATSGVNQFQVRASGGIEFRGNVAICNASGDTVVELGTGLDYAEGFDVSEKDEISPGCVLSIDPQNPGKLSLCVTRYDKKVAGIAAGANGLGSGIQLGSRQYDCNVALAGRVYCNVDATVSGIEPGDLLTTSSTPGYAMKVVDYNRAQGAIIGKAMQKLEKGKRGQILVLVTLQ
jgi:hypothetical protein